MKRFGLIFAVIFTLSASDDPQRDLEIRAQTSFDRLILASTAQLNDAEGCIQSQAALLPTAPAHELPLLHFRKAYCSLAQATLTSDSAEFLAAASEFDAAAAAWTALPVGKKEQSLSVPVTLRVLGPVARLATNPTGAALESLRQDLNAATQNPACDSYLVSTETCRDIVRLGNLWRARLDSMAGDWQSASALFSSLKARGWSDWSRGRSAFSAADYPAAVESYQAAVTAWRTGRATNLPLLERLEPQPDFAQALTDLGGAQLLARSTEAAIATLTEAAKDDARNSRALYLRARAKETAGRNESALEDLNLASRTAFADESNAENADGHFYRGILLFRSKQFTRAENEFATALNSDPSALLRPDASAWKRYAAVAAGGCGASRTALEQSLASVSPYFPIVEARAVAHACDSSNPAN